MVTLAEIKARLVSDEPFPQIEAGQWVRPVRRGYLMECCDCGLVHRLNFKLEKEGKGHVIYFQAFRVDDEDDEG